MLHLKYGPPVPKAHHRPIIHELQDEGVSQSRVLPDYQVQNPQLGKDCLKKVCSKIWHLWLLFLTENKTTACQGRTILELLFWSNSSGFHFPAPFEPPSTPLRLKGSLQLCSVEESSSAFKNSPPLPATPQQSLWLLRRAVVRIAPWPRTQSSSLSVLPRKSPWHEQLEWPCEEKIIMNLENKESYVWNLPVRNANIQWHQYRI